MTHLKPTLTPNARVLLATMTACIGGALFGGDTGSIGAITEMPSFKEHFGELSPLVRGFVVSAILIPSAFTGCLAGPCSDRISRKRTISLGAAIFCIGSIMSAASETLSTLVVARCIAGTGEGFFLGVIGVYVCEISPQRLRGIAVTSIQVSVAMAIACGFFVCYGCNRTFGNSSAAWRVPFALSAFFAFLLAVAAPFLPYSPRWLLSKGRREEAERALDLLAGTDNSDERRELLAVTAVSGGKAPLRDIFAKGVRGRSALGISMNIIQQLSGIDFVLFYAPTLFNQAGLDPGTSSFLASGVTGLVLFFANFAATFYIDKVGRRPLYIFGGIAIATCHLCIGSLYASNAAKTKAGRWAVIVFIELFAVAFSTTWSVVVRLYSAEIQPNRTRATATAVAQASNQLVNFVVAFSAPQFLATSSWAPYITYGAFSLIGTLIGYVFMYESRSLSLETIEKKFDGSAVAVNVPSFLRRAGLQVGEVRQRRASRRASQPIEGEGTDARDEFRANVELSRLDAADNVIAE